MENKQKEELEKVYCLLQEINKENSYDEKQEELMTILTQSQSSLLQEMKKKLDFVTATHTTEFYVTEK